MTQIVHIWMMLCSLNIQKFVGTNHPHLNEILLIKKHPKYNVTNHPHWMLMLSLNKHLKCDDTNHPHLDEILLKHDDSNHPHLNVNVRIK